MTNPVWDGTGRPPSGQYRITAVVTGDDLGPAVMAWLAAHLLAVHGHIVYVETVARLDPQGDNDTAVAHLPQRGSDVEAWIKRHRDRDVTDREALTGNLPEAWHALDDLLNEYRDHADTGTPLDRDVEGPHPEEG